MRFRLATTIKQWNTPTKTFSKVYTFEKYILLRTYCFENPPDAVGMGENGDF